MLLAASTCKSGVKGKGSQHSYNCNNIQVSEPVSKLQSSLPMGKKKGRGELDVPSDTKFRLWQRLFAVSGAALSHARSLKRF